jgi:hypothetical protein
MFVVRNVVVLDGRRFHPLVRARVFEIAACQQVVSLSRASRSIPFFHLKFKKNNYVSKKKTQNKVKVLTNL